ncbi:MAG: biopolymer transporter ExbD [Chitinophagaceae bacterium]|nr:biopolymer transporter ExbD [Chitinophagaceae bacterium]
MAEIISNKAGGHKRSTRIDLTPMVDLGFILITFFLFTTSLLKPNSMELNMPVDGPPTTIPDHLAYKLFLGKNHQWFVLRGKDAMTNNFDALQKINANRPYHFRKNVESFREEIKQVIQSKRKGTNPNDDVIVMIKPLENADYGDVVNALDEMNINNIQRFVLVDVDDEEKTKLMALNL